MFCNQGKLWMQSRMFLEPSLHSASGLSVAAARLAKVVIIIAPRQRPDVTKKPVRTLAHPAFAVYLCPSYVQLYMRKLHTHIGVKI